MGSAFGLEDLQKLAAAFAAKHLDEYVAKLRDGNTIPGPKEVNDALWGTVGLTCAEVVLLDSPLLQRLRYIRQLGVVHWVYPGAIHTRFEHTLGVLYQTNHIVTALNRVASNSTRSDLIDANYTQLLRLCALLHDVGHAAFSHVSEMAVEALPQIETLGADFGNSVRLDRKQLSEIFAFYVVRSPSMRGMFELLFDRCSSSLRFHDDRRANIDALVEKVSNAIIGLQINDAIPLLHELISGPYDADKLDYFVRDAKLAGTPSVVDISRLVQKLTVQTFTADELPREIGSKIKKVDRYSLFGMKWSGYAVLDELHLARVLLFAKIYRHSKVIAIEQMLRAAIQTIASLVPPAQLIDFLYTYPDDALLWMTKDALTAALGFETATISPEQTKKLGFAANILKDVRERRLWLRAYQIHRRYPYDELENEPAQKNGLIEFLEEVEHPVNKLEFLEKLQLETKCIYDLLHPGAPIEREYVDAHLMLHTLGPTPGAAQIARAYLLAPTSKPMPFREYTVNRQAWADSYLTDQSKGYAFAPAELADSVYLAIEKLIRIEHGVRLPTSAVEVAKRNADRLDEAKRKLLAAGYYRSVPVDIRPVANRLRNADVQPTIDRFDQLRDAFQEPQVRHDGDQAVVAKSERTKMWLRQFDDDGHVECALRLLDAFKMLTRKDAITALTTFINSNPEFRGAWVIPFGDEHDSGAIQTYYAADLAGTHIARCASLEDAKKGAGSAPLIFIDDFVASGGQSLDMLGAWFGKADLRQGLSEQRDVFEDETKAYLREAKIAFVFVAAWDDGIKAFNEALAKLSLTAKVYHHLKQDALPIAEDALTGIEPKMKASFFERCTNIGAQLLRAEARAAGKPVDEEKVTARSLGYGNRAMLLASPFNVPSQTLTAMWASGPVDGVDWHALLTRRKKV